MTSYEYPSDGSPSPHRRETHNHTEPDIQQTGDQLAVLHRPQRLILEGRECCVGPNEPNGNQIAPICAGRRPGKQGENESNQERIPLMLITNVP